MISLVTLDDCFNYLSERGLELQCGRSDGGWWVRLIRIRDDERVAVEGARSMLIAIKDAVGKWEARS